MAEAPDKIVEVPGVGNVSFPGGMADDAIAESIKGHLASQSATIDKMQAENPQPLPYYGFTPRNVGKNIVEGAKGLVTGAASLAKDVVTNPNWLTGKDSTLEKFVLGPAGEQAGKATEELKAGHPIQAAGHELAGALPMVGPWAASLGEQAGRGDIGGAAGQATGVMAAAALPGALGELSKPLRNRMATRIAGSLVGAVPKNTFEVSQPAPALVAEGPLALTQRGLLNKIGDITSGYGETVKAGVKAAAPATPESVEPLIRQATDPIINLARSGLDEATARRVEQWRDDAIKQYPGQMTLDKLYKLKQDIGKAGRTYKGGQAEEPGIKDARQALVTAINERIGQRIPGLRDITQRESGLITAGDLLENRARLSAGAPIVPGLRIFGGIGGGGEGMGVSARALAPFETLAKTAAIKALGTRAPLEAPIIPPAAPPAPPALPLAGIPIPGTPGGPRNIGGIPGGMPPVPTPTGPTGFGGGSPIVIPRPPGIAIPGSNPLRGSFATVEGTPPLVRPQGPLSFGGIPRATPEAPTQAPPTVPLPSAGGPVIEKPPAMPIPEARTAPAATEAGALRERPTIERRLDLETRHEVSDLMRLQPSLTREEAIQAVMDARNEKAGRPVEPPYPKLRAKKAIERK